MRPVWAFVLGAQPKRAHLCNRMKPQVPFRAYRGYMTYAYGLISHIISERGSNPKLARALEVSAIAYASVPQGCHARNLFIVSKALSENVSLLSR